MLWMAAEDSEHSPRVYAGSAHGALKENDRQEWLACEAWPWAVKLFMHHPVYFFSDFL
jgi:hypothetical protein